jgi:hypothetical protein
MFTVGVAGTPTAYQWLYNGASVTSGTGGTTASYSLSNVSPGDAGNYSVQVTWGSDGSVTSAPAALTVSGSISTTQTFAAWYAQYFGSTATPAQAATPQNDGVPNLLKYVFDINPSQAITATDQMALPTGGTDSTTHPGTEYLTVTYRQNQALDPSVVVNLESSTDLQNWTPVSSPVIKQTPAGNGDMIIETGLALPTTISTTPTFQHFIRLNVVGP